MGKPSHLPPADMARSLHVGELQRHLFLCVGENCCSKESGQASWDYLKRRLSELNLTTTFRTKAGCLRICSAGPVAVVYPDGVWYRDLTIDNLERVIMQHLVKGEVVSELAFAHDTLGGGRCGECACSKIGPTPEPRST
jgi:(2Fe-2S) ferredoxin